MEKLIKEKNYNCEVGQSQIIRIVTYYKSQEYVLKIYPSKDGITLVFKLERDKQILTNYYFEKFDLKDFHHTNKIFLLDDNIKEVFNHLHEISTNSQLFLEKEKFKIRILFRDVKEENSIILGVLGNNNKGKSFLLSRISKIDLLIGKSIETKGLSVKYPKLEGYNKRQIILLDSAGLETPVLKKDKNDVEKNKLENDNEIIIDNKKDEEKDQNNNEEKL